MHDKIDQARREFNALLEYLLGTAQSFEIHKVEEEIFRRLLRLGRLMLELFVLGMGTGKLSKGRTDPATGTPGPVREGICPSSERLRSFGHTT
jgi:hypothetical protein